MRAKIFCGALTSFHIPKKWKPRERGKLGLAMEWWEREGGKGIGAPWDQREFWELWVPSKKFQDPEASWMQRKCWRWIFPLISLDFALHAPKLGIFGNGNTGINWIIPIPWFRMKLQKRNKNKWTEIFHGMGNLWENMEESWEWLLLEHPNPGEKIPSNGWNLKTLTKKRKE